MNRRDRKQIVLWVAAASLLLIPAPGLVAQESPERERAESLPPVTVELEAQAQVETEKTAQQAVSPQQTRNVSDDEMRAILVLQHAKQRSISRFAAERAGSAKVKQFAMMMALEHGNFIARLHADQIVDQGEGPQIGEVLQKFSHQIRERTQSADETESSERRVLAFRGADGADANEETPIASAERENDAHRIREQRQDVRDQRQDVREARRPDRDNVAAERDDVRQARNELRDTRHATREDERQVRRENARRFVKEFLPVLRDNLPEILDMVGEAVEKHSAAGDQRMALHKEFVDRHTETIKNELGSKTGWEFDHAYLQYEVLAHLEMMDAITTCQGHASDEFRPTLDDGLKMTEGHLQQARDLIGQLRDGPARSSN